MITVRVRDGRAGRDPALVDADDMGETLATFDTDVPVDVGHAVALRDGTQWPVIGVREQVSQDASGNLVMTQDVSIGDEL